MEERIKGPLGGSQIIGGERSFGVEMSFCGSRTIGCERTFRGYWTFGGEKPSVGKGPSGFKGPSVVFDHDNKRSKEESHICSEYMEKRQLSCCSMDKQQQFTFTHEHMVILGHIINCLCSFLPLFFYVINI